MKVLVVGSGGREHALIWKIAQSPKVKHIYAAPGNAGIASLAECVPVPVDEIKKLASFALSKSVDLTVVGPELPLTLGIVDEFKRYGLKICGPDRAAARIEGSKLFAKDLMKKYRVPTAAYAAFESPAEAAAYIRGKGVPAVIKADGLAAGKGVMPVHSLEESEKAIDTILTRKEFGAAGSRIVIEDFLRGEEASFIAFTDGKTILPMPSTQDHKAIFDGDRGPNTGGMGAYSPAPVVTPTIHARVLREIILPTVQGMAADGIEYTGFLYAGLMIDARGNPRTLEFNCRLGDPETQPIMLRLKSDLVDLLERAVDGRLDEVEAEWDRRTALGVVLAAAGYPEAPRTGDPLIGLPADSEDCVIFHAGTRVLDGQFATSGGRVLAVTALGDSVRAAQRRAYDAVAQVRFAGQQYRTDIGHRAINRRAPPAAPASPRE